MDMQTLDKVGEFLKNATPEDLNNLADDMAKNAPHLFGAMVQLTDKEKSTKFIEMNINMLSDIAKEATLDYAKGYVQGLIDGAYIGGLIDDAESKSYQDQLDSKLEEVR